MEHVNIILISEKIFIVVYMQHSNYLLQQTSDYRTDYLRKD